jgi:hypothetical protein
VGVYGAQSGVESRISVFITPLNAGFAGSAAATPVHKNSTQDKIETENTTGTCMIFS